ncbi:MAG TPA: phosphoserine phosphatase SerB [Porticoccaceae bacterium]|nr:phosphoserine phosphatase SerB [Porticoccaceae bacterium]
MKDIILINVFGSDQLGITSTVTRVLADFDVSVLDIGQAVIHDQLNLGILAAVPDAERTKAVIEAVLESIQSFHIRAKFFPISEQRYQSWVDQQGKERHIITLLARKIEAQHLAAMTKITAESGLNIDKIVRLSGRIPLRDSERLGRACVEFSARGQPHDADQLRSSLLELAGLWNIDIAYQQDTIYRRSRQLVVFDMDSTLVDAEVIDELAWEAGVGEQVALITQAAMRGELDFEQSFRQRVALLAGLEEAVFQKVADRLNLNEGAEYLVTRLKQLGFKTAIVSGGFLFFARHLQTLLGVDYVYANELDVHNGRVTGRVTGDIIDGDRKAQLLRELAHQEGLRLEQVIAVGDGANDLPMLRIAGLGIAFRAKPLVIASAKQSISNLGLDGILYLLGFSDRDTQLLER